MFGSTVYPQMSEFHDSITYAGENLSHLIPSANIQHPWNRGGSLLQDFVMVTEFSELEGPKPLFVKPSDGFGNFDINAFAVKIMSVDHQPPKSGFTLIEDKQVLLSETAEQVSAYVYYFILYDSQARGYVRPFCMAYVTPNSRKLITFYKEIHEAFSKVSHDLKVGNLRLFATEMRHQLRDLEYSYDYLTKLSHQDGIVTSPTQENSTVISDSSNITAQNIKLLKEETEIILEVLQQNKDIFENEFEENQLIDNKCDSDSQDGSSCGSCKDAELDSLHQRAMAFTKDQPVATSGNHLFNVLGHTEHFSCRPRGNSSSSESDLDKKLCARHESRAHCARHESRAHVMPTNSESIVKGHFDKPLETVHNHVTRLKSDSSVKPSVINYDHVERVSSVDRSHSCSDISSNMESRKENHEHLSQKHFPAILHSSESDFSTSSTSSQLEHSDLATALLVNKADKMEQILVGGEEITYKPKFYKPPSRKRFEFMLRNLKTLCINESEIDQWKQLELIQQHFSQDLAILKMQRLEKSLADPSCSLVTFGGCITNNFLHGLYRCDLETDFGTLKNPWHAVETHTTKTEGLNPLTRTAFHSTASKNPTSQTTNSHVVISSSNSNTNSDLSQSSDSSASLSSYSNLVSDLKLFPGQLDQKCTILTSRENEAESVSKHNYENTVLNLTCTEHSEDYPCINCKDLRIADKGTFHHMLCAIKSSKGSALSFDEGSDDSFHSVTSTPALYWPKPCLWTNPCTILADMLNCKEHEQLAQSLMHILQDYQNLNQLIASILSGRPVVVIGKSQSEEEVKAIIDAFSLFLPGNLRDQKERIVPWLKRPLHLRDLSKMQLIGLCRSSKRRQCVIPLSLMGYVSILDIEQRLVVAPNYQGKIVNSMLRQLQQFQQSPKAYLAFIHSCFQEMSSKAFLYYHSFCMTSVNPSTNNGCVSLNKLTKEFQDTSEQFLKTCNILHGDRKIIEYIASLVLKQVLKEAHIKDTTTIISDSESSPLHISYRPSFKWDC